MAKVKGGELVVRTLERAGVTHTFAIHGAHLESLFQSCLDHRIAITDVRHEAAAGHAAEGYARAGRRLGVAMVTAGPGFTNALTSIANAYVDRTPVLYLAGSAATRDTETNTLQAGIDQLAIARPITKWAQRVLATSELPRLVAQAVRLATTGPTGPVLLDLPSDVLNGELEETAARVPGTILLGDAPGPVPAAVEAALALLARAERPVIMVGVGAFQAGVGTELTEFVDRTGIPVFSDFAAHGLIRSSHEAYGGTFHKMDDLNAAGARPDAVLALGVRFGLFTLGDAQRFFPADAGLIHVEIDPAEIGRLRDVDVPVVADPRAFLVAANAAAGSRVWKDLKGWRETLRSASKRRLEKQRAAIERKVPPIHPLQAVQALVQNMPAGTLIVGDGAEAYHWLNEVIAQEEPASYLTHGFLGTVGMGLGLAIGAQTARPEKPVLLVTGDGAVGFTIAEFDTLARHQLPVVVVVMNNRSWGASQHFQEIVSGSDRIIGTRLGGASYHEVARAFGCEGTHVSEIAALGPAIRRAFENRRPICVNVEVDLRPIPPEIEMLMSQRRQ
jgi:thiamine pyrophosphate-dependent acetolactate synthase large subunit-like protein